MLFTKQICLMKIAIALFAFHFSLPLFAQSIKKSGNEFHVSPKGDDAQEGSAARPFKTIMAAANVALPGDVITVHSGVYRESVVPPRGGDSGDKRITYQA